MRFMGLDCDGFHRLCDPGKQRMQRSSFSCVILLEDSGGFVLVLGLVLDC